MRAFLIDAAIHDFAPTSRPDADPIAATRWRPCNVDLRSETPVRRARSRRALVGREQDPAPVGREPRAGYVPACLRSACEAPDPSRSRRSRPPTFALASCCRENRTESARPATTTWPLPGTRTTRPGSSRFPGYGLDGKIGARSASMNAIACWRPATIPEILEECWIGSEWGSSTRSRALIQPDIRVPVRWSRIPTAILVPSGETARADPISERLTDRTSLPAVEVEPEKSAHLCFALRALDDRAFAAGVESATEEEAER